ncbi:unnamed protein product [Arctia plantaginis]|uniref:Uncharacterized protein n=1 Tax=Arctia plantaginis TaxID=874455 RepID=A0A8S1ANS1_ARCPL|nr:unnamed protein product [Arctia plantaginis]CAB3247908.1 unnamed protein product [Arctia plantaginis]
MYAGCPVLLGSKWVCNKWIHQYGQDDFKPCKPGYQKDRKIAHLVTKISRDQSLFEEYKTYKIGKTNKATTAN